MELILCTDHLECRMHLPRDHPPRMTDRLMDPRNILNSRPEHNDLTLGRGRTHEAAIRKLWKIDYWEAGPDS